MTLCGTGQGKWACNHAVLEVTKETLVEILYLQPGVNAKEKEMIASTNCDVLVVGGGVAGIAAAIAAGRQGAKTILLENKPTIGGVAATGYCLHNYISRFGKQVVFGIPQEIVDRLIELGGAVGHVPYTGFVKAVTPVDGELFRYVVTEMLDEADVQTIVGVLVVGVEMEGNRIACLKVAAKQGILTFCARNYVDASGDGDVSVLAGAKFCKGDLKTGKTQPVSMVLRCYATDNFKIAEELGAVEPAMAKRRDYPDLIPVYFNGTFSKWNDYVLEHKIFPNQDHKVFCNTVWPNHLNVNTSAVTGIDATSSFDISKATVALTKQVHKISEFLKNFVPGFERAYFAPAAGAQVRETRRITGLYEITEQDILEGKKYGDAIGKICFPVDIHDPDTGQAHFHDIGGDGTFDIPFRALVPQGLANVVVAGRCISATQYAHGATRNMAPCMVTGQAAGTAASMATQQNRSIPEINVKELQEVLLNNGVYLEGSYQKSQAS